MTVKYSQIAHQAGPGPAFVAEQLRTQAVTDGYKVVDTHFADPIDMFVMVTVTAQRPAS